jgi:predicted Ser/Thr protein kinase
MTPSPPTKLGRYEIVDEIGRGAMGVVYLAWDPLIGRQVALKVLQISSPLSDEELRQIRRRFIHEAQSAGILSHRNIVTIHDVVEESEEHATFIAMEYVRGTDVKQLLKGGPLDLGFTGDVVSQVAEALDYAHARGVVHRDIKPANILITADRQVKITDFGIARMTSSNLTQDTQLLGTPNYMAPEQVLGGELDHRVDVFALGVLLYEMLTGQKPFPGENLTVVTHRIVYEPFTPLEQHAVELPPGIEDVIRRALEKKPEDRYAAARELAADLSRVAEAYRVETSLNETQEVILEPPPLPGVESPPGPRRGGWGQRLRAGGRAVAGLARRGLEALRGLEKLWGRRGSGAPEARTSPSARRLAAVAGMAALVGGVLGMGLLWWATPAAEPAAPRDPVLALYRDLLPLMQQGRRLLLEGNPAAAAVALRRAERLAPERVSLRSWRELAERQAEAFLRMTEREREIARRLGEAGASLASRRYQEALRGVEAVLELAPEDPETLAEAERIRGEAERGLAQLRRRARAEPPAEEPAPQAASEVAAVPAPQPAAPPPTPAELGEPTLEVELITEQPSGNLTVFIDDERLLDENFRFFEKKGFLGLGAAKPYDGRIFLPPTEVPRGRVTLRIYVTPRGQAAVAKILEGELAPGGSYHLGVFFSESGELTASLE